ncbi:hypothetical protein COW98_00155 [Candidatus Roizmanbacteria bacterium CG22_combo_CG10-13_8_21_14_all_35_9]|uniref:Uncharacterized protein n=5 Tax=Candidatus Roizmaniibacteriota TaxID=1752723 RepID=A0A2M8F447_9BACT|nr:MAG: hypothetical protein COX47_01770 [Candidatus Roizmanbacteria bacterium CG23_combo_of_CG06-09_8_20_14_all_35_49]PIP63150.1 MAG: hypothetical protein COW98_00155 [Candidatus Roizmanbacteria bacterium CG22_combo_CG10-13_8_21_14_all_35_9]PIY71329.1 MAG: hypothetical protein COY88_00960 [Candidatus Roizmanbacteria bacterium CG_4_10_14_0_8_um_filter_35_28]PJC34058.1 MAG: hypothetical protein CO048_01455 [Candidatus Roizmanbacteria bacterium CG_4_9_14_0_2_um_filter_35_15]PJC82756.1 MAG: hypoth
MMEKIIGYLLIIIGVFVIFLSGFNGYQILTKKTQPIKILNLKGININLSQTTGVKQPPVELVSAKDLNETLNFFAYLTVLGLFINVGFKIASLGVNLVRPIKIDSLKSQTLVR